MRNPFWRRCSCQCICRKKEDADGKLSGYIRIRSKTQGIALSLGDRITVHSAVIKHTHANLTTGNYHLIVLINAPETCLL